MKENRLYSLFLEVTKQCNAHCDHCGSSCDIKTNKGIDAKWFKKALDDVAEEYNPGTVFLYITGGEPLMRKDLFEITGYAKEKGYDWGLVTNGMLINDEIIKKLKDTGMKTMSISLDGMKETHESFRHVPGSFDIIVRNIKKLADANFVEHIQVTFTATKQNLYELPELYRFLRMLPIHSLRISNIDCIGRAKENKNLILDRDDLEFLFRFINKYKDSKELPVMWSCTHYFGDDGIHKDVTNKIFRCTTGINVASVLCDGTIYGCPNVQRQDFLVQGNIMTDNFIDIWKNGFKPFRDKNTIKSEKCNGCEYWDRCKGDSFHTFDFETKTQSYCFKETFSADIKNKKDNIPAIEDSEHFIEVKPKNHEFKRKLIFDKEASKDFLNYFKFGETHPLNMYEQQVALVGYENGNEYHVHYIVPCILLNRSGNMAVTNNFCLSHTMDEIDIINENLLKLKGKDYPSVKILGFAHSHPMDTEFRFSEPDVKYEELNVQRFGDNFLSVLVNPQKEKLVCFSSNELKQEYIKLNL